MEVLKVAERIGWGRIPRSTFYYELKAIKQRREKEKPLKDKVLELYERCGFADEKYGYRRICAELNKLEKFKDVGFKTVMRMMQELGIQGYISKNGSRYNSYRGKVGKVADNELRRRFSPKRPNQAWATDVTEFRLTNGTKVYLSTIKDLCDGSIVSYRYSLSPNMEMVHGMLDDAFARNLNLAGLVFHSDQGWQYQHSSYVKRLDNRCIIQSMSRKGNCLDNSKMETFFGTLKKAIWFGKRNDYKTAEELEKKIDEYIRWYNEERIQLKLEGKSPLQFRKLAFKIAV